PTGAPPPLGGRPNGGPGGGPPAGTPRRSRLLARGGMPGEAEDEGHAEERHCQEPCRQGTTRPQPRLLEDSHAPLQRTCAEEGFPSVRIFNYIPARSATAAEAAEGRGGTGPRGPR